MNTNNALEIKPIISRVTGASGDVANGGVTADTTVTVSGTAGDATYIELFDGSQSVNIVRVESGTWISTLAGLVPTYHIITAKALDGQLASDPWVFTVQAASAPIAITSIKDAAGNEIPNGGTLNDSSTVIISGTALANQRVELFDYAESAGPVNVDIYGNWKFQAWGLRPKEYSLKARGLYGSNPESAVRTFSVVAPLTLPSHDMLLSGQAIKVRVLPTNASWPTSGRDFPGNTEMRTPTGGVPPYQYSSNLPNIASVSDSGKVTGSHNGEARITVIDRAGATASYTVRVSGVKLLVVNSALMNSAELTAWFSSVGAKYRVVETDVQLMAGVYDWPPAGVPNELWVTETILLPPLPPRALSMNLWPIRQNETTAVDRRMPGMYLLLNW